MFIDLNEIPDLETLDTQVCIVGAGAAGISIARLLASTGIETALVESGGFDFEDETQQLASGEITGLPYLELDTARLRYLGGTTNHWAGQSAPMQPIDFAARPWVPHSGWPIPYSEFEHWLPRAAEICRLSRPENNAALWHLGPQHPIFPLTGTGFGPQIFRFPDPVTRFGEVYRQSIRSSAHMRCYLHGNVTQLETDSGGREISGVVLKALSGKTVRLTARHFILATGGIENCRMLLLSNIGNMQDQVGRYFMEHPNFDTGEVVLGSADDYLADPGRSIGPEILRFDAQLLPAAQERLGILNHSVFLIKSSARPGTLGRIWFKIRRQWDDVEARSFALRVRLEHAPNPDSRVELSDKLDPLGQRQVSLNLQFGSLESRTVTAVNEAFARALGMTDLGRMKVDFDPDGDWSKRVGWQYHHYGGTRMHEDPKQGVVDRDCRVHGTSNLYVAGSSVFPTCGHSNPTLNLIAMSLRLADHVRREISK